VLYAPLVYVVYASVNQNPIGSAWLGATTAWFVEASESEGLREAAETSIRLALVTSVLATAIGSAVAVAVRDTRWMRAIATTLAGARAASPEIIIATGLAVLLPRLDVRFGFAPMAAAHVAYLSAYVALLVGARAASLDPVLEDAALDLGAGRWRVLARVVLPQLTPAIAAGAILTAAFSFDDVALSLALRGPEDTTLPVYLLSTINSPNQSPAVYAVGTIVIAVGLLIGACMLVAARVLRR
jgi:ABC-type spermidine/putrescine transport system permease subunit II